MEFNEKFQQLRKEKGLTLLATILFIMIQEPYMAFFELWDLVMKGVICLKQQ